MEAMDILNFAMKNLLFISPALLLICSLLFAESMTDTVIQIVKKMRRTYRI